MLFAREPRDVYEALVAELSTSVVPTSIMGATLVGVGILATVQIDFATYVPVTVIAAAASALKIALVAYHRVRQLAPPTAALEMQRFEAAHMLLTLVMAASVGILGALLFQAPETDAHLIATALLFAYCSGVVSRLSVRPRIAIMAITAAAVPCLVSAALVADAAHILLSMIFLVFLLGGIETVMHAYRNASRHIATRLRMAALARHDPLTGLLNRFGLREAFASLAENQAVAVHAFDLDGFKSVNDRHGHDAGDRVLTGVAERLRSLLVEGELIARVGGDEFVVVQPRFTNEGSPDLLARRIHALLARPYDLGGEMVQVGVSIGYSTATSSASLDSLLRRADEASYAVKRNGGGFRRYG